MMKINMMSKADMVKGQGVLSAHDEQVALAAQVLKGQFEVLNNAKESCEITHYHSINPEFYLGIGHRKRQGKTVGYVHFLPETVENSIHLPRFMKKIFYRYMLSFYKRMDKLVTVNPYFIERLAHYGIPKERVTYIPNVVSEEDFYPLPREERARIRREYRISKDAFTVLCVGQLQKRKGVVDFVEAAKRMPDCMFVWAGGFSFGRISDGYEEIRKMMKHLPPNVRFLGIVEREKMNEIYNMADVMFLPSYEELFPMTILESMNCAVPVLVRNLPIYDPILFDYALRGDGMDAFVSTLKQLREDPDFYQRSAHASFAGHEFYSREHVGQMWKEFYEKTAAEGKRTVPARRRGGNVWRQKEQQFS